MTAKDLALGVIEPRSAPMALPGSRHRVCGRRRARAVSMEARMTLCNMSIEAGATGRDALPLDETTFAYVEGTMSLRKAMRGQVGCSIGRR